MKANENRRPWGFRSASFCMTLLVALGIIFIGARFIVAPQIGANGYGIPISSVEGLPFGRIKGIRDIFSGLVLLPFLFMRMRRAVAIILTTAIIVPATDFSIVLATNGAKDLQHLLIHGLTALYMIVTSILLFRGSAEKQNP